MLFWDHHLIFPYHPGWQIGQDTNAEIPWPWVICQKQDKGIWWSCHEVLVICSILSNCMFCCLLSEIWAAQELVFLDPFIPYQLCLHVWLALLPFSSLFDVPSFSSRFVTISVNLLFIKFQAGFRWNLFPSICTSHLSQGWLYSICLHDATTALMLFLDSQLHIYALTAFDACIGFPSIHFWHPRRCECNVCFELFGIWGRSVEELNEK